MSPRRSRLRYVIPVLLLIPIAAIVVALALTASSNPKISNSGGGLAKVNMPLGGGTLTARAIGGKEQKAIPVTVKDDEVWPSGHLQQGENVTVIVTVKRPGWVSWLAGSKKTLKLRETTPAAKLSSDFVTRKRGTPLKISFATPVSMFGASRGAKPSSVRQLSQPKASVLVNEKAAAGTVKVSAAARSWEQPTTHDVSWFPAGSGATAIARPAPGTTISPNSAITLTFSKPVDQALGSKALPPVKPSGSGKWVRINSHAIKFEPSGYGYGLGAQVQIRLPAGVNLVGGVASGNDPVGKWKVPAGSTESLQVLLADLGYLPVTYTPASGTTNLGDQTASEIEHAAAKTPDGSFNWRYPNTPSALQALWSPTDYTELTKGAVMAFESQSGLAVDGIAGPQVWKALINAVVHHQNNSFGYTFVHVNEASSNESETTWHNGQTVESGPVNTGIAAAPTAKGTFAVYLRYQVTTMSGLNPDGTTYHDPGIKWVSYFNGGDALHEYPRASYGFPQSLGCVEMPMSEAAAVWPYTPIGTIVQIA